MVMSRAELARQLGVSRTYITLLAQGKRKPSKEIADKLTKLKLTVNLDVNLCTHNKQTSNPLGGMNSVFGGFDSHPPPPASRSQ